MSQDRNGADAANATIPSRRQFLASAGATTAGVAVSPLLAGSAAAAAVSTAPAGRVDGATSKVVDLAKETSVDAGQRLTSNTGLKISDNQNQLKAGPRGPTGSGDQQRRTVGRVSDPRWIGFARRVAVLANGRDKCSTGGFGLIGFGHQHTGIGLT